MKQIYRTRSLAKKHTVWKSISEIPIEHSPLRKYTHVCHSVVLLPFRRAFVDGMGDIMRKGVGGHGGVFRMFWHILYVSSSPSRSWYACHITTATALDWFTISAKVNATLILFLHLSAVAFTGGLSHFGWELWFWRPHEWHCPSRFFPRRTNPPVLHLFFFFLIRLHSEGTAGCPITKELDSHLSQSHLQCWHGKCSAVLHWCTVS